MIRCLTQLCAVVVLEDNCILDIYGIIRCNICSISHTGDYFIIPTDKFVSVRIICRLRRSFGRDHFIPVMICRLAQLCAVVVLENYCVLDIYGRKFSRILCIALTNIYRRAPADELIRVRIVRRFYRSFGQFYRISVMISFPADLFAVVVFENNGIININDVIRRRIYFISFTDGDFTIPARESICTDQIRFF